MTTNEQQDFAKGRIRGQCPMGCGETLFIGSGGYITCSYLECPNASAVSFILDERETEHIVVLGDETFTVRHPLRERIDGQLERCQLHTYLHSLDGPPRKPGTYRATEGVGGEWKFSDAR